MCKEGRHLYELISEFKKDTNLACLNTQFLYLHILWTGGKMTLMQVTLQRS